MDDKIMARGDNILSPLDNRSVLFTSITPDFVATDREDDMNIKGTPEKKKKG